MNMIPDDLSRKLKSSVTTFCTQTIRPVVEVDKAVWNARVRRNELYYRGLQDLLFWPQPGGRIDYVSASANVNSPLYVSGSNNQNLYDYILNFFQGDVDTFIAVIASRFPNGQAQAIDPSNDDQVRLKMKADRVNAYLDSQWDMNRLHTELTRGLAIYGTMFGHVGYVTNPRKYGVTSQQNFSLQQVPMGPAFYQCPWCGQETEATQANAMGSQAGQGASCSQCTRPLGLENLVQPDMMTSIVPGGFTQYENGAVEADIYNPACVTTALWNKTMEEAPWLILETEDNKGGLIQAYPELRDQAYLDTYSLGVDAAMAMGRYTRELLTSPTTFQIPRVKNVWLHTRIWITAAAYEYLPNDQPGTLRQWLKQNYPDGLYVPMVNGEALTGDMHKQRPNRCRNERLGSVWAACKPKVSEMLYADPYFESMIQCQDTVNDMISLLVNQAERSNPFVIADPEVMPPQMVQQLNNIPGEFKFAMSGTAGRLDQAFFRVPAAELNDTIIQFIDKYVAWSREITGITPTLFGGVQDGPEMTARQAEIMRNQAMMKLNVPWANARGFWAKMRENGIYQAAKYSGGKLLSTNQQGTLETMQVDGIWELLQGGWKIKCEESMPQTIGQRRDWVMHALTMPPEVQSNILGVNKPGNIVKIQESVGMADWDTPGYKQVVRLSIILGKLGNGQPTPGQPGPPDPMTGQPGPPGPPQPSIQFNKDLFDPQLSLDIVREWILDDSRQNMEQENPGGFANVMAFLSQIQQAMPPQGPPPQPLKWTGNMNFSELTPDMQQAVAKAENLDVPVPPGQPLAIPKQSMPKPGPMGGPDAMNPPNALAAPPPPGGLPPADQSAQPPASPLAQPPGMIQ